MSKHKPHSLKHKGSYVGIGVGPIKQAGRMFTKTQLRDEVRREARGLNDELLEEFMSSVRFVGIHQPERESNWEWCPLKQIKGYCPGCTHIYAVAKLNYTSPQAELV